MTLTDRQRAEDYVHTVLHTQFCGKVPGLEGNDLFGQHDEVTAYVVDRLMSGPSSKPVLFDNSPRVTLDSLYPGLMLIQVGTSQTALTREEARQFGIDILATSEQGFMREPK